MRDAASALPSVEEGKGDKHSTIGTSHGIDFIPFRFSTFGSFSLATEELLSCICQWYNSHAWIQEWVAHVWVFCRLSFVGRQGVAE